MSDIHNHLGVLAADASFHEAAAALGAAVPKGDVRPLDEMLHQMQCFAAARRREVRLARLRNANRPGASQWGLRGDRVVEAISSFGAAVKALSALAGELRPLITPALDDVIALAADEGHLLSRGFHQTAVSLGYTTAEVGWLFEELALIAYRPVHIVCADGFEDFLALLDGISIGEAGLTLAGFVRFTGDPDTDRRLEKLIIRLRTAGVTASVFLALVIILTAHLVATEHSPQPVAG